MCCGSRRRKLDKVIYKEVVSSLRVSKMMTLLNAKLLQALFFLIKLISCNHSEDQDEASSWCGCVSIWDGNSNNKMWKEEGPLCGQEPIRAYWNCDIYNDYIWQLYSFSRKYGYWDHNPPASAFQILAPQYLALVSSPPPFFFVHLHMCAYRYLHVPAATCSSHSC